MGVDNKISDLGLNDNDEICEKTKKPSSTGSVEDGFCMCNDLVEHTGVEPVTSTLPA